jgi:hypothetical protein
MKHGSSYNVCSEFNSLFVDHSSGEGSQSFVSMNRLVMQIEAQVKFTNVLS